MPIEAPEGWVVFKCDKRNPPQTNVTLESVRDSLIQEVKAKKIQLVIHNRFQELKEQANPQLLLPGARKSRQSEGRTQERHVAGRGRYFGQAQGRELRGWFHQPLAV